MSGFKCPYCNHVIALNTSTCSVRAIDFRIIYNPAVTDNYDPYAILLTYYRCPNCGEESIVVDGKGTKMQGLHKWIRPSSIAIQYPDYIPEQIRSDYEEAAAIKDLSPKASATLARRCLQGMIRDFWNIHDKPNLYQEIDAIKEKVAPSTWKALDATRKLGNIGAHMEKEIDRIIEIDPFEAERLIKLIELLMKEWYINRHDSELLLDEIVAISEEKQICKRE